MEENKIMSAPSVDRNSNALATLLAEVEKSLALHDYVTGGVDYGYISTGLQAAFDAVKSAAPQQVDAVQAVPVDVAPLIEALQKIDSHLQVFLEGGYGKNGDRDAYFEMVGYAQTWLRYRASPSPAVPPEPFDFHAHLARQAAWSEKTFGPGPRTKGVCDHIRKELGEVEADPFDLKEWVDVVILALDGAWRCGGKPDEIIAGIVAKQTKNEGRVWPDWRTADPDKAIEHDRSHDALPTDTTAGE